MKQRQTGPIQPPPLSRVAFLISLLLITATFLLPAVFNRLPILFPDTVGYSSAGEAVLGVVLGHDRRASREPGRSSAARAARADKGISEARSPYYGVALALADRSGGVWLAAAAQATFAAVALLFAVRRLGLTGTAAIAAIALAVVAGLAFYAGVLIPDVFLGPALLALAFLLTAPAMPRNERAFWVAALVAGLLFHRGFLAVGLVVVAGAVIARRAAWFVPRGWALAAAACLAAAVAHAAVAPVIDAVYGAKTTSQPFLLARMIEGRVVPAYLDEVCPTRAFLLCRFRDRLPMDHDQFLWFDRPAGVFNVMSVSDRQRLNDEANTIVGGAVAARPVDAVIEAASYSLRELFFAGMNDFAQRVPARWGFDAPLVPAMAAYGTSGIVAGDFPLAGLSRVTQTVYVAALAVLAAAAVAIARPAWFGCRRRAPLDQRLVAAVVIVFAGLVANAAVSGTLSGIRDRYTGRIAWLASVAAAATLCHALVVTGPSRGRGEDA